MNKPPNGFDEIKEFYEWKDEYLDPSGQPLPIWEAKMILINLPSQLTLSWNTAIVISKVKIHRNCAQVYSDFFEALHQNGLMYSLNPFGGSYNFRLKRISHQLSMHAFGAAMDFNPLGNPMEKDIVSGWEAGKKPFAMNTQVVEIARALNIKWGGDFNDPMHFQYGIGY